MALWLLAWVGVPILVVMMCVGLALVVQAALRVRLAAVELVALGFAGLVVITTLLTEFPAVARMASALTLVAVLLGWGLGGVGLLERPRRWWALGAGAAVYAIYSVAAAAVGVTWTGFISLDDTATWLAFADRLVTAGHTTEGLAGSTFGRLIEVNWSGGYPVGAFGSLGVVAQLLHVDAAWAFHPMMATTAAVLAAALYALTTRVVRSPALRLGIAVVAASSALLFGYVLWGGLKEIVMAALLAVAAVFVARDREGERPPWTEAALLAIPLAAIFVVFGLAGMVYIAPLALVELLVLLRSRGLRPSLVATGVFVGLAAVLAIPALRSLPTQLQQLRTASLMGEEDIGNLYGPLNFWQVAGVWPATDFRLPPAIPALTWLLIAVVVVLAMLGVVAAVGARVVGPLAYLGTALVVAGYSVLGNAWLEGKALAVSSPAVLLLAGVGAAWLVEGGRRFEGVGLGGMVALGVAASLVLAYRSASVAPPARMLELAQIGSSQLPTQALILEYNPLAARWFLRNLDAEGAGELRYNLIPLRTGEGLGKGEFADIDDFPLTSLAPYPTLVLRTDLNGSRPPSNYRLERHGQSYDVWVADPTAPPIALHLPLGSHADPAAEAPCELIDAAAAAAGPGGQVAVARRAPVVAVGLADADLPAGWTAGPVPGSVSAGRPGEAVVAVDIPAEGVYRGTLGGSVFGPVTLYVDGEKWTTVSTSLNWTGYGTALPPLALSTGQHILAVEYRQGWGPGQAHAPVSFGPLLLSEQGPDVSVEYVPVAQARSLCGQRLDWVEAIPAG